MVLWTGLIAGGRHVGGWAGLCAGAVGQVSDGQLAQLRDRGAEVAQLSGVGLDGREVPVRFDDEQPSAVGRPDDGLAGGGLAAVEDGEWVVGAGGQGAGARVRWPGR